MSNRYPAHASSSSSSSSHRRRPSAALDPPRSSTGRSAGPSTFQNAEEELRNAEAQVAEYTRIANGWRENAGYYGTLVEEAQDIERDAARSRRRLPADHTPSRELKVKRDQAWEQYDAASERVEHYRSEVTELRKLRDEARRNSSTAQRNVIVRERYEREHREQPQMARRGRPDRR